MPRLSVIFRCRPGIFLRFGHQVLAAFNHTFQTHIFSVLPASFSSGFKSLIEMTLEPYLDAEEAKKRSKEHPADLRLWAGFECLGMLERFESLISSVCYEAIEKHARDKCAKSWAEPELANLREWMTDCIVPWMLLPYARGARNCTGSLQPQLSLIDPPSSGRSKGDASRCRGEVRFSHVQDAL